MVPGFTVQLAATCTWPDLTTVDCTADVVWVSSDDGVAFVSNAAGSEGLVTGYAPGIVTITAVLEGVTATATVTVTE